MKESVIEYFKTHRFIESLVIEMYLNDEGF